MANTPRAGQMNYGAARGRDLPIGSGVIESTIRRVVNLRLKGASVYWKESTAQDMLLLRCFYKASRWQTIKKPLIVQWGGSLKS